MTGQAPRKHRVLFFDYWTKGIDKFTRLVKVAPNDAEYTLFHLGSWRDSTVPVTEVLDGIKCVDIAAFPRRSLAQIIREFDPDVIVGLNMSSLFDRALFLTARSVGVPTVFLQHGSWYDADQARPLMASIDKGFTWRDRVVRLPRIMRLIPFYTEASGCTIASRRLWRLLVHLASSPTLSHFYPLHAEELCPSLALVFREADAEKLVRTHAMPRDRIEVVGNPELDDVWRLRQHGLSVPERKSRLVTLGFDPNKPVVCYLEDGFVEQQQWYGWTEERRVELMKELAESVEKIDAQLLVRPHPASNAAAMQRAFTGCRGAVVTRDFGLSGAVALADIVMGTISTALETPVILGRPILVPLWHIGGDVAASPFVKYGVAEAVDHPDLLPSCLLAAIKSPPSVDSSTFFCERLGPVDGNSTERASKAVLKVACDYVARAYKPVTSQSSMADC